MDVFHRGLEFNLVLAGVQDADLIAPVDQAIHHELTGGTGSPDD